MADVVVVSMVVVVVMCTDFPEEELFCQKSAKVTLSKIVFLLYMGQVHDLSGS